jgi:hypothetical protein
VVVVYRFIFYFWQQRFKLFTKCWKILSLSSFSTEDKTNQKLPTIDLAITIGLKYWKVGWLRADDQTILSLHRRVVTHNPRVSVTHDESRTWNLHIRQVKESDQGCYMCQVIIGAFPFVFISLNCFNCRCTSTQFVPLEGLNLSIWAFLKSIWLIIIGRLIGF